MSKHLLKWIVLFGIMFLPTIHLPDSPVILTFLSIVLFLLLALLFIIFLVLVIDLKIFQKKISRPARTNAKEKAVKYSVIQDNTIKVFYSWKLNGGGIIFSYEFVKIISERIGKVNHVFEYCAGPGFIGFNLLANNLCDRLTLADVNPAAVDAIKETIRANHLEDRVTVYESNCLDSIPASEKWDLVVGNPPWHLSKKEGKDIRVADPGGRVHRKFFQDVLKFLNPRGQILFIESFEFTRPQVFEGMIKEGGLQTIEAFPAVPLAKIFKEFHSYPTLKWNLILFLRLCHFVRETYFIRVGKKD